MGTPCRFHPKRLPWLALLAALFMALGCTQSAGEPARPPAVPVSAFWLGGPDGGVFVALKPRSAGGSYAGTIYHPDGSLWYSGEFRLRPAGAAAVDPSSTRQFVGWDGMQLLLDDGRSLVAAGKVGPPR